MTSLLSVNISTEDKCGAAILLAVGMGDAVEGEVAGRLMLILSCVVRVASLRR